MTKDGRARAGVEVVLVDPDRTAVFGKLRCSLERDGWAAAEVEGLGDLPQRLGPRRKAVVVIHAHEAEAAFEALKALETKRHSTLVIVIADHGRQGEYYCLMQAGVVQYFEIGEEPDRILQGVEWAARVLAP